MKLNKEEKAEKKGGKKATEATRQAKTSDIVFIYNVLRKAKCSKQDKIGQFTIIRAIRALKPIATAWEDFLKDARERLKPDGFDEIAQKTSEEVFKTLPPEEQAHINKVLSSYDKDVSDCIAPELDRIRDIDRTKGLSEDVLSKLMTENDLTAEAIILIQDILGTE